MEAGWERNKTLILKNMNKKIKTISRSHTASQV